MPATLLLPLPRPPVSPTRSIQPVLNWQPAPQQDSIKRPPTPTEAYQVANDSDGLFEVIRYGGSIKGTLTTGVGTITSLSSSGFTLTTATGGKVTIKEASATTYEKGTSTATSSAVATGEPVLVLGATDNTTITAAQVIVQPPKTSGSNPGGQVISATKGEKGSTEKVGQIPSDYTQGSGTLASGTTADKAIEAALAAYPGGIVDRVVELGNGQYEVHNIGVNWPHHIFVNQDFQVIGADD